MLHPAYGRLWIFVKGPYSCKNLIEEIFNFSQVMYNLFDEASSFFFSFSYLFYYRVFIAAIQLVTASADVVCHRLRTANFCRKYIEWQSAPRSS